MTKKIPEILLGASRQYKHNNDEPGFIHGFDYEATLKIVATLQAEIDKWKLVAEEAAIANTKKEACLIVEKALKNE